MRDHIFRALADQVQLASFAAHTTVLNVSDACAAVLSVLVALAGDRLRMRGVFVMFATVIGIAGVRPCCALPC